MNIREFEFSNRDFEALRKLVKQHTGINLSDHKKEMLYSRLARRLRALNLDSFASYCKLLQTDGEDELMQFMNSVTTNLTAFFREPHHFDFLGNVLLPELMNKNQATKKLRIWSAGCASGEEPYSIAMVVKEVMPIDWDVRILATDLDSNVLARGTQGIYDKERLNGVSEARLQRWFKKGTGLQVGKVQISPQLQEMVAFKRLNLMHIWPMRGPLDIIFCRNVVIYFDKPTQRLLFDRFANLLAQGGHLFIGHSENLFQLTNRFRLVQQTVYTKSA